MNFLNATWLLGLFSLFIPILLHLQKRKIKTIDWAAVRFLKTSIVNRRRGLTLEHYFLLLCRCLLLVAFVFLFARPWTNPGDSTLFGIPGLFLIVGLSSFVMSITWAGPQVYRILTGGAGCMLVIFSLAYMAYCQEAASISGNYSCDTVIVIDGSDSMGIENVTGSFEARTLFSTAVKEAQKYLDKLPAGSTATFIVVGDDALPYRNSLKSNIPLLRQQMESVTFPGGANDLRNAIESARLLLKNGTNARQQILVITDDQLTNWQSLNSSDVKIANPINAEEQDSNEHHKCGLIVKVLNLPEKATNLAVTHISIEDRMWRVGEKARVNIEIFNGGTALSDGTTVDFQLNETLKQSIAVEPIEPGARQLIPTEIVFDHSGSVSLGAKVNTSDIVPQDDECYRALWIQSEIKVLIVDGDEVDSQAPSATRYIRLAMNSRQNKIESIPLRDINTEYVFDRFDVICLCNVARLSNEMAEKVAKFVKSGGGLFVFLGADCDRDFYNTWQYDLNYIMPFALTKYSEREQAEETSTGLDWTSVKHPALQSWLASGQHDLSDWRFDEYWLTSTLDQQNGPNIYARLNYLNGYPFFAEHSLGQGRVVVQTSCPLPRSNNLINRISFPVWHHILTRYLAQNDFIGLHQKPTSTWIAQIPLVFDDEASTGNSLESESAATLTSPLGIEKEVPIERDARFWKVDLRSERRPGLYKLMGPFGESFRTETWRLSIERDANESNLSRATEEQIQWICECLNLDRIIDESQWIQAATGEPAKEEWWRLFAYCALALLVFESIILRWLAKQRGQPVFTNSIANIFFLAAVCWLIWWQGWLIAGNLMDIQYSNSVPGTAGLVTVLSCVIAATYWDSNSGKIGNKLSVIKLVRLIEMGIIGFILLEPLKEQDVLNNEIGTIAVLWDRSESMTLREGETTREEIARKVLVGKESSQISLLDDITQWNNVQLYQYAASPQLIDYESISESPEVMDKNEDLGTWDDTTKLTDALQRILDDTPKELLTGVIIISDGCDRSQISPSKIASNFAEQKIPIHAIIVGNQKAVADASVAAANAPNQIYMQDQLMVSTNLHFDQLKGETATVHFYREQELLDTKSIPIISDQQRTALQFTDIPKEIGMHHYQIKIDSLKSERIQENNQRELSVWVTNDRLNLLIIEQRPRWEFRYLKNLFAGRDKNVSLQHVLLAPDRLAGVPDPFPMVASTSRAYDDCEANRLPESELEWLKFDVIVLGDIDPEELNEEAQRSIEKFVSQRGGTLVVISGPNSMPHKYVTTPLFNLLPTQNPKHKSVESNTPYRLRMTNDGISSTLLSDISVGGEMQQTSQKSAWDRLPILHWRHSHAYAKPGATVLAWADHSDTNDGGQNDMLNQKPALILWHRYGGGKVLQMNFDQTWRLRYWNGDELHHRFWGKVMRWGTEDRLGLGTELVRLGLDKSKYKTQESMTIKVRLVEEATEQLSTEMVRCELVRDGVKVSDVPLEQIQSSGGLLQARLTLPKISGRYRIQVTGPRVDRLLDLEKKIGHSVSAEFYVEDNPADDESNDLIATTAVLAPITNLTGGKLLDESSIQLLSETFTKRTSQNQDRITKSVWDIWPVGGVFVFLILCEWVIRKQYGFI